MARLLAYELQLETFFTDGHWRRRRLFPLAPFVFVALAALIVAGWARGRREAIG